MSKTFPNHPRCFTATELLALSEEELDRLEREAGLPDAPVKRCSVRDGIRIFVVDCPYCGREHTHGGGYVHEPPDLGHRNAHCPDKWQRPNDGYVVTDPNKKCPEEQNDA